MASISREVDFAALRTQRSQTGTQHKRQAGNVALPGFDLANYPFLHFLTLMGMHCPKLLVKCEHAPSRVPGEDQLSWGPGPAAYLDCHRSVWRVKEKGQGVPAVPLQVIGPSVCDTQSGDKTPPSGCGGYTGIMGHPCPGLVPHKCPPSSSLLPSGPGRGHEGVH